MISGVLLSHTTHWLNSPTVWVCGCALILCKHLFSHMTQQHCCAQCNTFAWPNEHMHQFGSEAEGDLKCTWNLLREHKCSEGGRDCALDSMNSPRFLDANASPLSFLLLPGRFSVGFLHNLRNTFSYIWIAERKFFHAKHHNCLQSLEKANHSTPCYKILTGNNKIVHF